MRILPEEERLDMLAMLAKSRAEATEKLLVRLTFTLLLVLPFMPMHMTSETVFRLQGLPFVTKTERHRKLKIELEDRLQEIAEAVEMFSQPEVLVEL